MSLPKAFADILTELEGRRAELKEALRGLSDKQVMQSAGPEEWNAAQVVDHLLLAESFTSDITKMMVERARAEGDVNGFPEGLLAFDPLPPPISLEAPPPIRPRQTLHSKELIAAVSAQAERTKLSMEALAAVDPRKYRMGHPLFGELDMGQWWAVHPMHYKMHIAQARVVLAPRS